MEKQTARLIGYGSLVHVSGKPLYLQLNEPLRTLYRGEEAEVYSHEFKRLRPDALTFRPLRPDSPRFLPEPLRRALRGIKDVWPGVRQVSYLWLLPSQVNIEIVHDLSLHPVDGSYLRCLATTLHLLLRP